MRRYYGSDDDEGDEPYEEEDQGSPMQLSRGTATPFGFDPGSTGKDVPWITDEQEIVPSAATGTTARPEWMTRSQETSPADLKGRAKKRLGFEGLPGPRGTEE